MEIQTTAPAVPVAPIDLHKIASQRYDIANTMLREFHAPPLRKSGFPYFCKLSTYTPPGTPPAPEKRKPVRVNKLTAGEIDMLLE